MKTEKFKEPKYLGDPRNVVKIFNEKEVDELAILDITATPEGRPPTIDLAGTGSMAIACWTRRKNSLPRDLEVWRLKRNVNSSR